MSILFVPEEEGETRSVRLSAGLLKLLKWIAILLALILAGGIVSFVILTQKTAQYGRLLNENLKLLEDNRRIYQQAEELNKLKQMDLQIRRSMGIALGLDSVYQSSPDEFPDYEYTPQPSAFAGGYVRFIPPADGLISRGFKDALFPQQGHTGIDFALPIGTLVNAAADGWALFYGWHYRYGNYLIIQHPNDYTTFYGHNQAVLVEIGEQVKAGQPVAISGDSGHSSAPHLHFEIRHRGKPIDPVILIPQITESENQHTAEK